MTCPTCGCDPCRNPSFCRACRDVDRRSRGEPFRYYRPLVEIEPERLKFLRRLMSDDVSLERASADFNDPKNRPTPQTTIEAIVYVVRERGLAALREPATAERLERCDAQAKEEIERRIEGLKHAKE